MDRSQLLEGHFGWLDITVHHHGTGTDHQLA
jgi:hypothetical protein